MTITEATNQQEWDTFLCTQQYRPFLQSWAMGEVYHRIGQEPVRLIVKEGEDVKGICFAHVVPARRGRHLSVPYGPVMNGQMVKWSDGLQELMKELKKIASEHGCSFTRMSPFWVNSIESENIFKNLEAKESPLHLLAEHLWYLPLQEPDPWASDHLAIQPFNHFAPKTAEEIFKEMRSTTRNLIRRAEKEGVTVEASGDPIRDLPLFMTLHEETRKRHGFTPYTDAFFRAQVEEFHKNGNVTLYLARYQGEAIAASVHVHFGGETSYHHGASTQKFKNIPASYLLQWTAIQDALQRGDRLYNFWGIAPQRIENKSSEGAGLVGPAPAGHNSGKGWSVEGKPLGFSSTSKHPFAGVTLFKTGFGGKLLELTHCRDIPLSPKYYITRGFETVRKWQRGF